MGGGPEGVAPEIVNVPLHVRGAAREEIRAAIEWYEVQSGGLGTEFLRCLDACLSLLARHPEIFPEVHDGSRIALLRRFPYFVIYCPGLEFTSVLAVMHASKPPRRWKERVGL